MTRRSLPRRLLGAVGRGLALALRLSWLLLISALALLWWLLFTTEGARWAVDRAAEFEPRLSLTVEEGSLWQGLAVRDLVWEQDALHVAAHVAGFRWDPLCLIGRTVCLDSVTSDGLVVRVVADGQGEPAASNPPDARWSLPLTIRLSALRASETEITVAGHVLTIASIEAAAAWSGDRVLVNAVDVDGVDVVLADQPVAEPDPRGLVERLASREAVALPTLRFPIDVELERLLVEALSLRRGDLRVDATRLLLRGGVARQTLRVDALELDLDAPLHGVTLRADGRLEPADDWPLDLAARLVLTDPSTQTPIAVSIDAWNTLHALELDATLDVLLPRDPPHVVADQPQLAVQASIAPLSAGFAHDLQVRWAQLHWPLVDEPGILSERGKVHLRGDLSDYRLDINTEIAVFEQPLLDVVVAGSGDVAGLRLTQFDITREDAAIQLAAEIDWSAIDRQEPGEPAWAVRLASARLTQDLLGPPLTLVETADIVGVDGKAWLQPHCWQWQEGRVCLLDPAHLGPDGDLRARLSDLDLAHLDDRLPDWLLVGGVIDIDLVGRWAADVSPQAGLQFRIDRPQVQVSDDELGILDPQLLALDGDVQLREGQFDLQLAVETARLGGWRLTAGVQPDDAALLRVIDGRVEVAALQIEPLIAFLPQLQLLEGIVDADLDVAGPLDTLQWQANLRLRDGAVETFDLPVLIEDVGFDVLINGERAELHGEYRIGAGRGTLDGTADWRSPDDWQARVRIGGDALDVAYDAIAALQADLDLTLDIAPGSLALGGQVSVPSGRITVDQLPAGAVDVSDDVIIINDWAALERPPDTLAFLDDVPDAPPGWVIRSDIEIVLGDDLRFDAFRLTGALTGRLRLQQLPGQPPQASGEANIVDGEYRAYGQRLRIERGQFLFSGPLDQPDLLVEAIRRSRRPDGSTVIAGVRLEGSPQNPVVSLFSDPAMDDDAVLAYLLLGRPLGEGGVSGARLVGEAAVGWGVAGGRGLADRIASELGIADFEIDAEEADGDAYVVMRGRLSPNLFVSYGVGLFDAHDTLLLRYRLSRRLAVEAVSGLENAVDLLYTFEFGTPRAEDRRTDGE